MIKTRCVGLVAAWAIASSPVGARAQERESTTQLAQRITVGDFCTVATEILASQAVAQALGAFEAEAQAKKGIICQPLFSEFSILALSGGERARMKAVARIHSREFAESPAQIVDAMKVFMATVRKDPVGPVVTQALGTRNGDWISISQTAEDVLIDGPALEGTLDRLSKYQRKLGPSSARLNAAEVVLNYGVQRWVPLFRASPLKGPSPLEIVAAYSPGYITFDGGKDPIPVSASEFGLRYYLFGDLFGKTGWRGLFLPSHFSVGVLTASDDNGAMRWPWRGRDRSGVFVAWGSVKVGYIDRDRGSFLVTKQFQAVPLLF